MTTLQTVFPKDFDTKETPNDDHINHIMRLWYDYDLIGWFVYVVCLNDAKSCENNVYRAILGKHDVFPGDTMFSQCAPENTRFSYLSCKKLGFRCFRCIYIYRYTHMHCMCCLATVLKLYHVTTSQVRLHPMWDPGTRPPAAMTPTRATALAKTPHGTWKRKRQGAGDGSGETAERWRLDVFGDSTKVLKITGDLPRSNPVQSNLI